MASVYDLKPAFQRLLRPAVETLARKGVAANQVTISALLLSLLTGLAIMANAERPAILLLLPIVLFLRMALNAIDGMLAREHDQKTRLGAVLNELGDVISDTALYLPLAAVNGFDPRLIALIVLVSALSEMTGVLTQTVGASRRYDGPMGKSDRAFVFGTLGLVLGLGVRPDDWLIWVQVALLALLALTVYNRVRRGLAEGSH